MPDPQDVIEVRLSDMSLNRLAYEYRNSHDRPLLNAIVSELERRERLLREVLPLTADTVADAIREVIGAAHAQP